MLIRNQTPFVAGYLVMLDIEGAEHLIPAVRGTWSISERGELEVVAEPPPIQPADEHVGEPGLSSIRYEADLGPMKPATDVALVGSAVAPRTGASQLDVSFRAGSLAKKARVVGERKHVFGLLAWWFHTPPKRFRKVPLQWELAAGGTDATPKREQHHSIDLRNPLGRGFRARGSKQKRIGAPLPQIETPAGCRPFGGKPEPAGFGFIGPNWLPRRKYAGTYDDAWQKNRCPLLPEDFDPRFHNNAAPGLTAKTYLQGNEPIEVIGCTRAGKLAFRLPVVQLEVTATLDQGPEPIDMKLVSVTVDTDAMQLRMLWRGDLHIHKRFPRFSALDVKQIGGSA